MGRSSVVVLALANCALAVDLYPAPPNPFGAPKQELLQPQPPPPLGERLAVRRVRRLPRWQPVLCLGLLCLAGASTKPRQPSLLAALDAYYDAGESMASPVHFRDCGIASVARHDELLWLGLLGRWLPLVPTSLEAARELATTAGAAQLLLWSVLGGYLVRKLLPRGVGDRHLSKSFQNVLRRGRLWTLLSASFCPSGLVHLLHASMMLLLVVQGLEGTYSRLQLLGLYAAAGASAALLSVLGQLVFRRAAEPRPSVSGAVMGLLVLRAAVAPQKLLSIGRWQLPIAWLLALHILLDAGTNAPHEGLGLGKLLDLLGGALMVATVVHPQLQLTDGGWRRYADWRLLLDYAKSAF